MSGPSKRKNVGYKNPPAETQFKAGNTYGKRKRRRKVRQFTAFDDFEAVLNHKVPVTINGETTKVPIYEALLLRLRELANTGSARAIKMVEKIRVAMPEKYQSQPNNDGIEEMGIRTQLELEALLEKAQKAKEEQDA